MQDPFHTARSENSALHRLISLLYPNMRPISPFFAGFGGGMVAAALCITPAKVIWTSVHAAFWGSGTIDAGMHEYAQARGSPLEQYGRP
ncbi:MAG TPA: hypothetical protein VII24_08440 [Pseudolabrys sp.]|jgi:hypothetical protein